MWWWAGAALAQEPGGALVELTLSEALDRLHADGPDLRQVEARAAAARGVSRQAMAAWMPIVAVSGGYTRNDSEVVFDFGEVFGQLFASLPVPPGSDPPTAPDIAAVTIQPLEVWNVAATAQLPLFAPSAWAEWRAATHAAEAAGRSAEEASIQLEAALVGAAASVEAAAGVVEAATRALEVAQAHLDATRVAVVAGTATPVDELAAQADVAKRKSELVAADAGLDKAREGLGAMLGVDGPVVVTIPPPPASEPAPIARPALAAADAQHRAADARVDAAWLRHLPTISATATGLAQTEPFPTTSNTAYRLGVSASWALYDGGLRYGRLDQAQADRVAATAFRDAEVVRVAREARDAERDLAVATEQLALAEEQATLTARAAEVAMRGLAAGTISPLQSRDAETLAFQASVGVVGARARLTIAQAALRRARGLDQRW